MAYEDFIDILRTTSSDKTLQNKSFAIASNPQYDEYQLCSYGKCKFFNKRTGETGTRAISKNQQLVDELCKPIIKNVQRHKLYSSYRDGRVEMQLIRKSNKGIRFLLCVTYIYRVVPLKGKKVITITKAFHKVFDGSGHKPNKIWVYQGSEIRVAWLWR